MSASLVSPLVVDPELVGAKGARLALAAADGVRVPRAMALTTAAYQRFFEANALEDFQQQVTRRLARDGSLAGIPDLEEVWAGLRPELVIPGEVQAALAEAMASVAAAGAPVILRSSANLEDSPQASLAGLFHSVPGLTDAEGAGEALLEIWARAQGAAIVAALLERDMDPGRLRVAVLVQEYLELERMAVSFSVNPRDNRASPLIETMALEDAGSPDDSLSSIVLLSPFQRSQVTDLDQRLRDLLEGPVDMELGWVGGGVTLLQARPQVLTPLMNTEARWSRSLTSERYPLPLTPLGFSNIEKVFDAAIRHFLSFLGRPPDAGTPVACQMGGVIYANQELFSLERSVRPQLSKLAALRVGAGVLASLLTRLRPWRDLQDLLALGRAGGRLGDRPDSFGVDVALRVVVAFLDEAEARHVGTWEVTLRRFLRRVTELEVEIDPGLSVLELRRIERELTRATIEFLGPDLVIYALKEVCFRVLEELLRLAGAAAGRRDLVAALGIMDENPTTAMNRELVALARLRGQPAFAAARSGFLERFGHITCSWDVRDPLLGEDAQALDALLEALAEAEPPPEPPPAGPPEGMLRDRVACYPRLLVAYDQLTARLRRYMKMDEEHHLYTSRVMVPCRRMVRILAERLVDRGVLPDTDAIHFLRDEEVWRILLGDEDRSRHFLVATRRGLYQRQRAALEEAYPCAEAARWRGLGAAAGEARGPARRVASLRDAAAVVAGEILVVRTPDPAWTMVYPLAAGVVAETGALLSHGVVAAREHGIPVVVGVEGLFGAISDGRILEIDGTHGEVRMLAAREPEAPAAPLDPLGPMDPD